MEPNDHRIATELLLAAVSRELAIDLDKLNKEQALRKALLYLIFLTQETAAPAGQDFIQYLLNDFSALGEFKGQYRHPFLLDEPISAVLLENGDSQVVVKEQFIEKFADLMNENKLMGEKLPRSLFEKIDVYFNNRN